MGKYPEAPKIAPPSYDEAIKNEPQPTVQAPIPEVSYVIVSAAKIPANTNVIIAAMPRSEPVLVNCPFCFRLVTTKVRPTSGCLTWLSCATIAFFGGFWGCCLIPFCIPKLMDVKHICPSCNAVVAKYERL